MDEDYRCTDCDRPEDPDALYLCCPDSARCWECLKLHRFIVHEKRLLH